VDVRERASSFLEEFTDFILEDKNRRSLVVNIKKDYFRTIYYELKKIGYQLVHKSTIKSGESFTLVFVYQIK